VRGFRFFDERVLKYVCDAFRANYAKPGAMLMDSQGKPILYSALCPVYSLNLLGFTHFTEDDDAVRIFELYDAKHHRTYPKRLLRIGFFELGKPNVETSNQQHWRDYFLHGEVSPSAPEYIRRAAQIIEVSNLSEEERDMISAAERTQADNDAMLVSAYWDGKDEGIAEGKAEGIVEGKVEGKIEIARAMLSRGLAPELVAECTGLPRPQILMLCPQ
jgi:predicted transposase/invertase (TIGR01784 family)